MPHAEFNFRGIPGTVEQLFTPGVSLRPPLPDQCWQPDDRGPRRRVITMFLDALGWCCLESRLSLRLGLLPFVSGGRVSLLTSQFASMTPAHVTTFRTGLPTLQTGIVSPRHYEPEAAGIFEPFRFALADVPGLNSAFPGVSADRVLPFETIYQRLWKTGVGSLAIMPNGVRGSVFGDTTLRGSRTVGPPGTTGYGTYAELDQLISLALAVEGRVFIDVYVTRVDRALHQFGLGSPEADEAIDGALASVERVLATCADGQTTLVVFADHGQVPLDSSNVRYLSSVCPMVHGMLAMAGNGAPFKAGGTERCMFLHVRPTAIRKAIAALGEALGDYADVYGVADLRTKGMFGSGAPRAEFEKRVGTVVVVPRGHGMVWLEPETGYVSPMKAGHGGLHPDEMRIGCLVYHC